MSPRLDRRLVLEAQSRLPDGAGGFTVTWLALGTLWAAVDPGTGRDAGTGQVAMSELPMRITVRAAPEGSLARPAAGQRLVEGARRYRILSVADAGQAGGLYLTCFAKEEAAR